MFSGLWNIADLLFPGASTFGLLPYLLMSSRRPFREMLLQNFTTQFLVNHFRKESPLRKYSLWSCIVVGLVIVFIAPLLGLHSLLGPTDELEAFKMCGFLAFFIGTFFTGLMSGQIPKVINSRYNIVIWITFANIYFFWMFSTFGLAFAYLNQFVSAR